MNSDDNNCFYDVACELNNLGADLLELQCYDQAVSALGEAINALRLHICYSNGRSPPNAINLPSTGIRDFHAKREECRQILLCQQHHQSLTDYQMSDDNDDRVKQNIQKAQRKMELTAQDHGYQSQIVIHSDPVKLVNDNKKGGSSGSQFFECSSATFLFNTGLTNHLRGIETGNDFYNERALNLYKMAMESLCCLGSDWFEGALESNLDQISLRSFAMVILNNMGQIHYEARRYKLAKDCFDSLLGLQEEQVYFEKYDSVFVQDFVLNSMFVDPPTTAKAA